MREVAFSLSIDEHGSCEGFSSEADGLLHARYPRNCIVEIHLPLPPGTASARLHVTRQALASSGATTADASAWLALDEGGSCIAYAGAESDLPDIRRAADRYAQNSGLDIAVVRVDVPLPAGSAPARVSLI
jgi:hypothetical protein